MEWDRALGPLDSVQRALVSKTSIVKPDKRYTQLMDIVRQRRFPSDPYLKALNVQVDSNEMLKIKGKLQLPIGSDDHCGRFFSSGFTIAGDYVS